MSVLGWCVNPGSWMTQGGGGYYEFWFLFSKQKSLTHLLTLSLPQYLTLTLTKSPSMSLTHSLTDSVTNLVTHSVNHSLIPSMSSKPSDTLQCELAAAIIEKQ